MTKSRLILTLGMALFTGLSAMRKARKYAAQHERRQRSKALSTWEDEGGYAPVGATGSGTLSDSSNR